MDISQLATLVASMGGLAAIITIVINALKQAGVVTDGTSQTWSTGLNLLALVVVFAVKVFIPTANLPAIDQMLGSVAGILGIVLTLVIQLLVSKGTHTAVRGVPLVGKSFTVNTPVPSPVTNAPLPTAPVTPPAPPPGQ